MKPFKIAVSAMLVMFMTGVGFAAQSKPVGDLTAALAKAKTEKKPLFILYGRAGCGNCQAVRGYIHNKKIKLPEDKIIYVDLNCDDKDTAQEFSKRYKVEGNTLPFVVVADADGKQLAARTGYGEPAAFTKLIHQAEQGSSTTTTRTSIKK